MLPDTFLEVREILDFFQRHIVSLKPLIDDIADTEFCIKRTYFESAACRDDEYHTDPDVYEIREKYGKYLHDGVYKIKPLFASDPVLDREFDLHCIRGCELNKLSSFQVNSLDVTPIDRSLSLPDKELNILISAYKAEIVAILNNVHDLYVGCHYMKRALYRFNKTYYDQMILLGGDTWKLSKSPDLILNLIDNLLIELEYPGVPTRRDYISSSDKPLRSSNIDWATLYSFVTNTKDSPDVSI